MQDTNTSEWLKLSELIAMLSMSRDLILRLVNEGQFPKPVRFSRKFVRWDSQEVQNWIYQQEQSRI